MSTKRNPEIVRVAAAYHLLEKAKELLQPATNTARLTVGRFVLESPGVVGESGMVWIEDKHGGALLADERGLEKAIEKYFEEQFKNQKPKESK